MIQILIKRFLAWWHNLWHRGAQRALNNFILGERIAVTPGKRHAWYESSIGRIRKPI